MIYVKRENVPTPAILESERAAEVRKKAAEFFRDAFEKRTQERFEFDYGLLGGVRESLAQQFHGKCAYCESQVGSAAPMDVDHFRPKANAVGLESAKREEHAGSPSPDGYWWLAYEWANLYAACQACNRNKRNRFPVIGRRATWEGGSSSVENERALLLDPCRDEPERFLSFDDSGLVRPGGDGAMIERTAFQGYHRGEVTIEVLGLNRAGLVEARAQTVKKLRGHLGAMTPLMQQLVSAHGGDGGGTRSPPNLSKFLARTVRTFLLGLGVGREWAGDQSAGAIEAILVGVDERLLGPDQPYLAVRRRVFREWISEHARKAPTLFAGLAVAGWLQPRSPVPVRDALAGEVLGRSPAGLVEGASGGGEPRTEAELAEAVEPSSPEKPESGKVSRCGRLPRKRRKAPTVKRQRVRGARKPYIQSIEIENFRAIDKLRIEFPEGKLGKVGWKVLLGENGTGKSSILQAVALALVGPTRLKRLGVRPQQLLRRLASGKRAKKGVVRLQLSTESEPLELRFSAHGMSYRKALKDVRLFVRGYASTRRIPSKGRTRSIPHKNREREVESLFHQDVYLCDPRAWMRGLPKPRFDSAAMTIKDLLQLEAREPLRRMSNGVNARIGGLLVPLDELSDGYQSVLAMAGDILAGSPSRSHDMRHATGIILLDEIDAHLHPRWKMRIVSSLRAAFPRMQFLVTTHEPLCLRGLAEGEIMLMRRTGHRVYPDTDLPSPTGMRVDQILTSPFFGLGSTLDPELDKEFMDYYLLLGKAESELNEQQRAHMARLKEKLKPHRVLGDTRRDQLVSEMIDEYLAKDLLPTGIGERKRLRTDTKRRIAEIWKRVDLLTEDSR